MMSAVVLASILGFAAAGTLSPTYAPTMAPTYAPTWSPSYTAAPTTADTGSCEYAFATGDSVFQLPPAQPVGSGDVMLNEGNPIVSADGTPIVQACNGQDVTYYYDGQWLDSYTNGNGAEQSLAHQFYATNLDGFYVASIQEYSVPSMFEAICGTTLRLQLSCNNNQFGCIEFSVIPDPGDYTCP